jgi:hypothetical protein
VRPSGEKEKGQRERSAYTSTKKASRWGCGIQVEALVLLHVLRVVPDGLVNARGGLSAWYAALGILRFVSCCMGLWNGGE